MINKRYLILNLKNTLLIIEGKFKLQIKNCKLAKITIISITLVVIILVSIYIRYLNNGNNIPRIANYYGSNYSYSISLTRFLDYKSFLNSKSSNIQIYDSEDEFSPNTGFITGEILIQDTDNIGNSIDLFQSCNIELIRVSEWNTSATSMNFDKPKDGITKFSFIAYDIDDSAGNIYKSAIIKIGTREIPIELNITK